MPDLAVHIVETKAGQFEPEKFEDHYQNALKELIKKKQRGEKIEESKESRFRCEQSHVRFAGATIDIY